MERLRCQTPQCCWFRAIVDTRVQLVLNRWVQSHRNRGDPETALTAPMGTCTILMGYSREIKNP